MSKARENLRKAINKGWEEKFDAIDKKADWIDEGIKAFREGIMPMAGNPYKRDSQAGIWWACGWEVGYIESKDEKDGNDDMAR